VVGGEACQIAEAGFGDLDVPHEQFALRLGQHTAELPTELGLSAQSIGHLRDRGLIAGGTD
jgi:hypothetical protein